MTQARGIARTLEKAGHETTIEVIRTLGDVDKSRPFAQVGAPGVFVRELEWALMEGRIDVAVHCYKDLPSDSPEELCIAAVPEREDPRDRLVLRPEVHDPDAEYLPLTSGALIGTASARRHALVRNLRGDLELGLLRGNVPTRVRKLHAREYDALLLACAGLDRLDRGKQHGEADSPTREPFIEVNLDPEIFVPAPSQGALALQACCVRQGVREALMPIDDQAARRSVEAERELLTLVEAGCQVPFGAFCRVSDSGELELHSVLEFEGELRRSCRSGTDAVKLAQEAFIDLMPEEAARP